MLNQDVFDQGIAMLMQTYRNLSLTEKQILTMRMLLSDVDDEPYMMGVTRVCRECREIYPGTNITALIRQEVDKFQDVDRLSPEEAWACVMRAVQKVGYTGKPIFRSKQVEQAVDCIGWREICFTQNEQLGVTRAHFMRAFEAYEARRENEQINCEIVSILAERKMIK